MLWTGDKCQWKLLYLLTYLVLTTTGQTYPSKEEVCGTDGWTYENEEKLTLAQSEQPDLLLLHIGPCLDTTQQFFRRSAYSKNEEYDSSSKHFRQSDLNAIHLAVYPGYLRSQKAKFIITFNDTGSKLAVSTGNPLGRGSNRQKKSYQFYNAKRRPLSHYLSTRYDPKKLQHTVSHQQTHISRQKPSMKKKYRPHNLPNYHAMYHPESYYLMEASTSPPNTQSQPLGYYGSPNAGGMSSYSAGNYGGNLDILGHNNHGYSHQASVKYPEFSYGQSAFSHHGPSGIQEETGLSGHGFNTQSSAYGKKTGLGGSNVGINGKNSFGINAETGLGVENEESGDDNVSSFTGDQASSFIQNGPGVFHQELDLSHSGPSVHQKHNFNLHAPEAVNQEYDFNLHVPEVDPSGVHEEAGLIYNGPGLDIPVFAFDLNETNSEGGDIDLIKENSINVGGGLNLENEGSGEANTGSFVGDVTIDHAGNVHQESNLSYHDHNIDHLEHDINNDIPEVVGQQEDFIPNESDVYHQELGLSHHAPHGHMDNNFNLHAILQDSNFNLHVPETVNQEYDFNHNVPEIDPNGVHKVTSFGYNGSSLDNPELTFSHTTNSLEGGSIDLIEENSLGQSINVGGGLDLANEGSGGLNIGSFVGDVTSDHAGNVHLGSGLNNLGPNVVHQENDINFDSPELVYQQPDLNLYVPEVVQQEQDFNIYLPEVVQQEQDFVLHVPEVVQQEQDFDLHVPEVVQQEQDFDLHVPEVVQQEQDFNVYVPEIIQQEQDFNLHVPEVVQQQQDFNVHVPEVVQQEQDFNLYVPEVVPQKQDFNLHIPEVVQQEQGFNLYVPEVLQQEHNFNLHGHNIDQKHSFSKKRPGVTHQVHGYNINGASVGKEQIFNPISVIQQEDGFNGPGSSVDQKHSLNQKELSKKKLSNTIVGLNEKNNLNNNTEINVDEENEDSYEDDYIQGSITGDVSSKFGGSLQGNVGGSKGVNMSGNAGGKVDLTLGTSFGTQGDKIGGTLGGKFAGNVGGSFDATMGAKDEKKSKGDMSKGSFSGTFGADFTGNFGGSFSGKVKGKRKDKVNLSRMRNTYLQSPYYPGYDFDLDEI